MTCIVGIETNNGIVMGGDSAAAYEPQPHLRRDSKKVFERGDVLIGYTSSFRMGQLLQYRLEVPTHAKRYGDLEYLATVFADAVRDCLGVGGFKYVSSEQETGGQFLIGYRSRLYFMDPDFHVNSFRRGYHAVGCGAEYALGSLHNEAELTRESVVQALDAAATFSSFVCEPFHIVVQKTKKEVSDV